MARQRNVAVSSAPPMHCRRSRYKRRKSSKVDAALQGPTTWKLLRSLSGSTSARNRALQPPVDDFAYMLESLFQGHSVCPVEPVANTEPKWTRTELDSAIQSLKTNKGNDEFGLVAELLKNAPDELREHLLRLFNVAMETGSCPTTWQKNVVQNDRQEDKGHVTGRFSSDCQRALVVQNVLLHDVGAHGAFVRCSST